MGVPLYVALYTTEVRGDYYWALVVGDNICDRVTAYQIKKGSPCGAGWLKGDKKNAGLEASRTFLCCVQLPSVDKTKQALEAFITQIPAVPDDRYPLDIYDEWNCAQWVIDVIRRLCEDKSMNPNLGEDSWEGVYFTIAVLAQDYERGSKFEMVGNIPVLKYPVWD